jgi:hypothetical protein
MNIYQYISIGTLVLLTSACGSLKGTGAVIIPTQTITNSGIAAMAMKYQNAACPEIDEGCDKEGDIRINSWLAHIETCQKVSRNPDDCKMYRNTLINELILITDHHYHAYEGGMLSGGAKNNFYVGALRSSLETAGALMTPANTIRILSGLAALTGTLQESANKEFYFDNAIDALIIQMRADRAEALYPLISNQVKPYDDYSIERAIADVTTFYRAGTLASAIISISKSATNTQIEAQKKLDNINAPDPKTETPEND